MSKQTLMAFLESATRDPELQQELMSLAAKYGYDLSSDELSESELAKVAGGVGFDPGEVLQPLETAKKKPAKK